MHTYVATFSVELRGGDHVDEHARMRRARTTNDSLLPKVIQMQAA